MKTAIEVRSKYGPDYGFIEWQEEGAEPSLLGGMRKSSNDLSRRAGNGQSSTIRTRNVNSLNVSLQNGWLRRLRLERSREITLRYLPLM
jgi:hypothetical protein